MVYLPYLLSLFRQPVPRARKAHTKLSRCNTVTSRNRRAALESQCLEAGVADAADLMFHRVSVPGAATKKEVQVLLTRDVAEVVTVVDAGP
ncbi:hypothetical protein E4U54_001004 [Claviceps lovelessii]|nr:hypothetical protein E4U54_001004 [Claviceps lovelessii]